MIALCPRFIRVQSVADIVCGTVLSLAKSGRWSLWHAPRKHGPHQHDAQDNKQQTREPKEEADYSKTISRRWILFQGKWAVTYKTEAHSDK